MAGPAREQPPPAPGPRRPPPGPPGRGSPPPGCTCAPTPAAGPATSPRSRTRRSAAGSTSSSFATRASRPARSWPRSPCSPTACRRHGKLLAVNDRADVAHAAGADVLHLGQGDLPVPAARALLGERRADRPVLPRRGGGRRGRRGERRGLLLHRPGLAHPHQARPPRARPRPGPVRRRARHRPPLVRDRGHRPGNVREVLDAGARRIVVVRAVTEAADPGAAAAALAETVRSYAG